jgi:hypothetical protein
MEETVRRAGGRSVPPGLLAWLVCGVLATLELVIHWPSREGYFHSLDDWYFLSLSQAVAAGEPGALRDLVRGDGIRAFRSVGAVSWLLNWVTAGLDASAYYLTNVALRAVRIASVFWLAYTLAGRSGAAGVGVGSEEPRPRRGPILAGLVAAVLVSFAVSTNQDVVFLAARDDSICTLLLVLAVAVWARTEGWASAAGAALLLLLACFSKPIALVGPALFVAADLVTGRLSVQERRRWLRYLVPAFAVLLYGLLARDMLLGFASGGLTPGQRFAPPTAAAVSANLQHAFLRPLPFGGAVARLTLLLTVVGLGLITRRVDWRLLGFGAAWTAINLAAPWSYLSRDPWLAVNEGRYLLLASVGFGLMVAAFVAAEPRGAMGQRLRWPVVLVVVLLLGGVTSEYSSLVRSQLHFKNTRAQQLVEDLGAMPAGSDSAQRAVVALQRPDAGLLNALSSSAISAAAPRLGHNPRFFVEGSGRLWSPVAEPRSREIRDRYIARSRAVDLDAILAEPGTVLVVERASPGGRSAHFGPRPPVVRYEPAGPLPAIAVPSGPLPRWSFADGPSGWEWSTLGGDEPGDATWRDGAWNIRVDSLPGRMIGMAIGGPAWQGGLLSPSLELRAVEVCGLIAELGLRPGRGSSMGNSDPILPEGAALAVTWSGTDTVEFPWASVLMAPVSPSAKAFARVDLRNSPSWRAAGTVRRIIVRPVADSEVAIRSITLKGCPAAAPDEVEP